MKTLKAIELEMIVTLGKLHEESGNNATMFNFEPTIHECGKRHVMGIITKIKAINCQYRWLRYNPQSLVQKYNNGYCHYPRRIDVVTDIRIMKKPNGENVIFYLFPDNVVLAANFASLSLWIDQYQRRQGLLTGMRIFVDNCHDLNEELYSAIQCDFLSLSQSSYHGMMPPKWMLSFRPSDIPIRKHGHNYRNVFVFS